MEQAPLLSRTLELLENSPLPLTQIASESQIGIEWLRKFSSNRIPNPGVILVQKLHDYLAAQAATAAASPAASA